MTGGNNMSAQRNTHRSLRQILIGIVSIGAVVFLLFFLTCLLLGKCYLEYDSTFTEFYVCQEATGELVRTLSTKDEDLFLCGAIQGTTPRPGGLYLFYNDVVILNTHFEQLPGEFMVQLPTPKKLETGHYRVEIGYAKRILASTEFEVIED